MCTCISLKTNDHYFGRTLDLEYHFGERVVITPRNYHFDLKSMDSIKTKYAIIGMATVNGDYPLYAEATNEKGLSMAGLNFPKNSCLFPEQYNKLNLAQYELIPYFLGLYGSVSELKDDIKNLNITNIPNVPNGILGELHYMICDESDCIVVEQTSDGLHIYDNPYRVMTNNPIFLYHLENIKNYVNINPNYPENNFSNNLNIIPYGQGIGSFGLPGDTSPASRFIKACFLRENSVCDNTMEASVSQFFHILDNISMVRGSTITKEKKYDITTYYCCINTTQGIYFYKTYENNQINAIRLTDENKNKDTLSIYELIDKQNINYIN